MNLDLLLYEAFMAFIILVALLFFFQRIRYRRRKRLGKKHFGFYPSAALMGNALQSLQLLAQPDVQYILEEKQDEDADEDGDAGPDDPTAHLNRQLKRIRRGEPIDTLKVPLNKSSSRPQ
jgi:hypothetical protein